MDFEMARNRGQPGNGVGDLFREYSISEQVVETV